MQILKSVILRCLPLLFMFCLVAGCDDLSYLNRQDEVLILKPPVGSDPEKVMATLKGRFEDFLPSIFSSVEARVESGEMQFLFHRGVPESKYLPTLFLQRGVLTATLETGEVIYTNDDIQSALAMQMDGKVYLKLEVTDEAARRIGEITANNKGKMTNVVLDGFPVFNSTIDGPFSKSFKLSANYPFREVQVIKALLDYGALPGSVGVVSASRGMFDQTMAVDQPAADGQAAAQGEEKTETKTR